MPVRSVLACLRHVLLVVLVFGLVGCRQGSGDGERRRVTVSGPTLTTLPHRPSVASRRAVHSRQEAT